jgi:hypothetical protein
MSVILPNVIMRGTFAARPAANSAGSLYFASDTGKQYRDNGISWDEVTPTGGGTVTHTVGPLTSNLPVLGNGGADVKAGAAAQLVPTLPADATKYLDGTGAFSTPPGTSGGSVTSVALTMPAEFSVSGSPVTSAGTMAVSKATQAANLVYAGPSTGSAAAPAFRALVAADVPASQQPYLLAAAFTGGGSALASGTSPGVSLVYCVPVARACTLIAWTVTVDAGTAGFRVWRKAAGSAVPTVSDTITTADLAISTGTNLKSTTFTNFTGGAAPTFAVGDIVAIQLNAAATATFAAFSMECT